MAREVSAWASTCTLIPMTRLPQYDAACSDGSGSTSWRGRWIARGWPKARARVDAVRAYEVVYNALGLDADYERRVIEPIGRPRSVANLAGSCQP